MREANCNMLFTAIVKTKPIQSLGHDSVMSKHVAGDDVVLRHQFVVDDVRRVYFQLNNSISLDGRFMKRRILNSYAWWILKRMLRFQFTMRTFRCFFDDPEFEVHAVLEGL